MFTWEGPSEIENLFCEGDLIKIGRSKMQRAIASSLLVSQSSTRQMKEIVTDAVAAAHPGHFLKTKVGQTGILTWPRHSELS